MCDVFQENKSLQCAFLIDVNAENPSNEIKPLELSNAIRLCILRILTYFSDQIGKKTSHLRWGYKFYNSRVITHVYERHEFKEFKAEYFEEFEQDICKRIDESFDKETESIQNSNVPDGELHQSSGQNPSPSKCLSCALTDIVHDFEWERPEITSPFKRSRRSSQTEDVNKNLCSNFVFLFTWCPCSKNLMASFCNRSIKSFDDFRNVVLPTALYQKFRGNCKISLFWVDTGLWWWKRGQYPLEDWSCRLLVKECVKSVGGCLIPLSALVNLETFSTRETTMISRKAPSGDGVNDLNFCHGVTSCGILLPFASVMNHFLYQCDIELADLELKTSSSVIGDDSWTGLLCTTGNSEVIHCTVKLNPIFNHIRVETQEQASSDQCSNDHQAGVFWIQGVVQRQEFCPSWLHPTKSYSCVGFATSGPSFSGWFQELIAALNKKNLLLVIDFPDPNNGLPLTGVMQPLTSIAGVLSVTNPDAMLGIEKLLLWHGKRAKTTVNHLVDADNKMNTNPEKGKIKQLSQSARKENGKEKMGDTRASSIFSSSDLNPLHARRNSAASISLLEELTSVSLQEESDECEDESELVRQLREVYRKKRKNTSTGSRKHTKGQESNKEGKTPEQRKSQKSFSRNKLASSKEKLRKQKSVKSSRSSPSHTNNDVQGDEEKQTSDKESESNQEADEEEKIVEFQDKNELIKYLKEQYCSATAQNQEVTAPDTAQHLVNTIVDFLKSHFLEDVQAETKTFIKENFLMTHHSLREKYENQEDEETKKAKLNEYYLQVLLRMELAAVFQSVLAEDQLIDEVTVMLRSISFLKDPGFLSVYLREELLKRYGKLIPKFVRGVYEGLMQDPPDELLSPSERNDVEESPLKSAKPPSISTLDSQEPRSEGNRFFTRHRSMGDLGKRREIVVPGKVMLKGSQKQVKPATKKAKKESPKSPVKKVRRNLFTDESGGESAKDQPSQTKKEDGRQQANLRWHSVAGPLKTVQETPARKQIANALWRRQHRGRKRASTMTEVEVVQESPLKQLQEDECLLRRSPRRHKGSIVFQRSQSFYGRSASARPITRTKSFTATSVRDSTTKKPEVDDVPDQRNEQNSSRSPVKSPSTVAQIISPLRFSPRLRKRFSLHSLLKTTMDNSGPDRAPPGKGKSKPKTPEGKKPQELRSSPRLLKKRSFSCIGFTTTAPLKGNEKKSEIKEGAKNSSSSGMYDTQKTPQESRDGTLSFPENRTSDELNSITTVQPSTPENIISPDDIENFITPVKQLANSPVFSSSTLGKNGELESPEKTSIKLRNKPLKRNTESSGEELTVVQDVLEKSPILSRSLRKRTSFKNDDSLSKSHNKSINTKGDVSSLSMAPRSGSCEHIALRGDFNVKESTAAHFSGSPQKVTDSSREHENQSLTEEATLTEKSYSDFDSRSGRMRTRNNQSSPKEKIISTKLPLATRRNRREEAEPEKERLPQNRIRSSGNISSSTHQDTETSCPTDVLQLAHSPTKSCTAYPSPLRILSGSSPNESKTHAPSQHVISTPPMNRRRGNRSLNSPADRKRLSPLNQILKQRKPKPGCLNKSPTEKNIPSSPESVHSGLNLPTFTFPDKKGAKNSKRKRSPNQSPRQAKRKRISSPKKSKNTSKSSDESSGWLEENEVDENTCVFPEQDILCQDRKIAEKNSSPVSPMSGKRRIDKSVVFGGKNFKRPQSKRVSFSGSCFKARRRSSDAFDVDPDDDVFQSLVSVSLPQRRTRIPRTPVSLNSIRQLQESPILYGASKSIFNTSPSKFRISPSSLTRKWAQFSPDAESRDINVRLRLQKQSSKTNSELVESETDVLLSDREETKVDSEEMQTGTKRKSSCSLKLKKRLQLAS